MGKATLTEVQIERAKNLYTLHQKPLQSIAQDLGVSVPTISRYLKLAGVTIRGKGRPKLVVPVFEPTVSDLPDSIDLNKFDTGELNTDNVVNTETPVETPVFDFN